MFRSLVADSLPVTISLSSQLAADRHAIMPFLRALVAFSGVKGTAALLSVPSWVLNDWLAGRGVLFAKDRKLIWLVHSLLFRPELLSSPFHIATFGRFWCGSYDSVGKVKAKRARKGKPDPNL